jgi:hypothetical protein
MGINVSSHPEYVSEPLKMPLARPDHSHASHVAQLHLALLTVHHNESQEDRSLVKAQRRPHGGGMLGVKDDDTHDGSVQGYGDCVEEAGLREVAHDADGYFRVEEESEQTHGCEEDKEYDVHNLPCA